MYSDMSMRTIACSSSNRNSASARAVSVFPTPVGPRKMKEPIGRLGSWRPARERRTAFATASTASRCPITRRASSSSSFVRRARSLSIIRVTGMPVHRDTISAMSSAVTSSFRNRAPPPCFDASACSASFSRALERRDLAVGDFGRLPEVARACGLLGLDPRRLEVGPDLAHGA